MRFTLEKVGKRTYRARFMGYSIGHMGVKLKAIQAKIEKITCGILSAVYK